MQIVFIGGVKFSHDVLSHLLKNNWNISTIFTYDDSKRKFYSDFKNFDDLEEKYNLKNIKVHNINDPENISILQKLKPDLILVIGWSQLLKNEIIQIPRLGVVGSHPTELPKYRGRAPIPWSIIKGLKRSALTLFYIKEGVDDGDILDQGFFKINPSDDATSLYTKMTEIGKDLLQKNLKLIQLGKEQRRPQNIDNFIENWPKRTPEDGKINWFDDANSIHTLIRATTHPYPGAFTFFKNNKIQIWKSKILGDSNMTPGTIVSLSKNGIEVSTKKGIILLQEISVDERKNISPSDFFLKKHIGMEFENG